MNEAMLFEVRAISTILGFMLPVLFWIAISLHRIANTAAASLGRRDPQTGVLSR